MRWVVVLFALSHTAALFIEPPASGNEPNTLLPKVTDQTTGNSALEDANPVKVSVVEEGTVRPVTTVPTPPTSANVENQPGSASLYSPSTTTSSKSRAIYVLSSPERGFIDETRTLIAEYASKCNAEFVVINDINSLIPADLRAQIEKGSGVRPLQPYIAKMLALNDPQFSDILLLDDTCIVARNTPNLFDVVPADRYVAGFMEGKMTEADGFKSVGISKKEIKEIEGLEVDMERFYINTGVVLVRQPAKHIFAKENIERHLKLFETHYPSQAYTAYMLQTANVEPESLPASYNSLPLFGRDASSLPPDYLNDKTRYIYHITGYYQNRRAVLSHAAETVAARGV